MTGDVGSTSGDAGASSGASGMSGVGAGMMSCGSSGIGAQGLWVPGYLVRLPFVAQYLLVSRI